MLVIFDLDETLVYGSEAPLDRPCDFLAGDRYFVHRRPHVGELVTCCLQEFDVAVWTSASRSYALEVVGALFTDPARLRFLWAWERCTWHFDHESDVSHWLKDLKKVKRAGYNLSRVLMVDDSKEKLKRQYGNHIPVRPYLGAPDDDELPALLQYLKLLDPVEDVRRVEKRNWQERIPLT